MTIFQAIVLGAVQGLTEFLPISSSGHLILVPYLFGWATQPLVFDTVLHVSTLVAVITVFWRDFLVMVKAMVSDFVAHKPVSQYSPLSKRLFLLFVGSFPAMLIGLVLDDYIENVFRSMSFVALFLAFGTVLLLLAERKNVKTVTKSPIDSLSVRSSLVVGFFQSLALLPGVSRSGSTISGGMFLGLNREDATKFSFLLSVPIILGASIFKIISTFSLLETIPASVLVSGFMSGLISGVLAIRILLKLVQNHSLNIFVVYRFLLVIFLLLTSILSK